MNNFLAKTRTSTLWPFCKWNKWTRTGNEKGKIILFAILVLTAALIQTWILQMYSI